MGKGGRVEERYLWRLRIAIRKGMLKQENDSNG